MGSHTDSNDPRRWFMAHGWTKWNPWASGFSRLELQASQFFLSTFFKL